MTVLEIENAAKAAGIIVANRIPTIKANAIAVQEDRYDSVMMDGLTAAEFNLWVAIAEAYVQTLLMNKEQVDAAKLVIGKAAKDQRILVIAAGTPVLDKDDRPRLSVHGKQWRQPIQFKSWDTVKNDWSSVVETTDNRGFCESAVTEAAAKNQWLGGFTPIKLAYLDGKQVPAEAIMTFNYSFRPQPKRGDDVYLRQRSRNLRVSGLTEIQPMAVDFKFVDESDQAD